MKNKENKGKSGELLYTLCFKFDLHWNRVFEYGHYWTVYFCFPKA